METLARVRDEPLKSLRNLPHGSQPRMVAEARFACEHLGRSVPLERG